MAWTTADMPDLAGRTCVVTGANTGIGYATVKALAAKRAAVVLACRNLDKGNAALSQLTREIPDARITVERLDLADLGSIRDFAARLAAQYTQLDVLINNAGVATPPLGRTADGFEIQFGTNFLGTFALTGRLLPLLRATPGSRVVTLSSIAHWFGKIDFGNLNAERGYSKTQAYYQSKLADLIFAFELQRRLAFDGATTMSIAVHPGVTMSELFRHSPALEAIIRLVAQSIEDGALPSLMAATAADVKGGDYIGPGGFLSLKGSPTRQRSRAVARDPALARRLWDVGQRLTGVSYLSAG